MGLFSLNCLVSTKWRYISLEVRTEKHRFGSHRRVNKTLLLTMHQHPDVPRSSSHHKKTFHVLCIFVFALSLKIKYCFLSSVFDLEASKHTLRTHLLIIFLLLKEFSSQQQHYSNTTGPLLIAVNACGARAHSK